MPDQVEWTVETYLSAFTARAELQPEIFRRLADKQWHCRECAGRGIDSDQYAGGGGIQGLQRGTKSRPGLIIESSAKYERNTLRCAECGRQLDRKNNLGDRWTGQFKQANAVAGIPKRLQMRIMELYEYKDSIEDRVRQAHELVIDHRFPMERRGAIEDRNDVGMTDEEIRKKFQLLKKDDSGNHNLLKSRACERCIATNKRGTPLGIKFYYDNTTEDWPEGCPPTGIEAEEGCKGCGWYDFATWRKELNEFLESHDAP